VKAYWRELGYVIKTIDQR